MTTIVKSVTVAAPVSVAYNTWTQFEDFPLFMGGVQEVRQLDDTRLHWVAEIAGVRREWDAAILEQVPDEKIAWAATEGATNAGVVRFTPVGPDSTRVTLTLEYEPEGLVEKAGDHLNVIERRTENDMENFKQLIETGGRDAGGWRGAVNPGADAEPGIDSAAASRGDSGKAGVSGKTVAAGVAGVAAAAAVAAAGTAAAKSGGSDEQSTSDVEPVTTPEPVMTEPVMTEPVGTESVATGSPVVEEEVIVEDTYPVADDPAPFGEGGVDGPDDRRA